MGFINYYSEYLAIIKDKFCRKGYQAFPKMPKIPKIPKIFQKIDFYSGEHMLYVHVCLWLNCDINWRINRKQKSTELPRYPWWMCSTILNRKYQAADKKDAHI